VGAAPSAEAVDVAAQSYDAESVSVEGVHEPSSTEDGAADGAGAAEDEAATEAEDDDAGGGTAASWLGPAGTKKNCGVSAVESEEHAR